LLPALERKQYRIYHKGTKPAGFVTWAWLNDEVEQAYALNARSLRPQNWVSGDHLWFIDLIAPFGDAKDICRDLRDNVFPNDVGRFLRAKKGDDTLRIMYVHGKDALNKARDGSSNPPVLNASHALR
jgi:cytolysin-activating lysine-acyltransferase